MASMDVFSADGFTMQSLTVAFNDVPHIPGRIGQMGVFSEAGVRTTSIEVENKANVLALIPKSERGGPATQNTRQLRSLRTVPTIRLAIEDNIYADEVQNVRAFGSESEMQSLQAEVNDRNADMGAKHDATLEHHRIGAIKGLVLDSDGSTTLLDIYSLFDVNAPATVDFALDAVGPIPGALRTVCSGVIRSIEDALGSVPYEGIHAFCSSSFFDLLVQHSEVRDSFLHSEGVRLRDRTARRELFFAGIMFEEYRGSVGGVAYIAAGDVRIFATGVRDLFITRFSPADYWDTVNTMGLPRYARQFGDPTGSDRYRTLETQSNVINLCTRPLTLIRGTQT